MRYCPFCGAELLGPEVSFCAECGKQIPTGAAPQTEGAPTERLQSQSGEEDRPEPEPADDYDGYYDDVEPIDAGSTRPGLDREMIKKISFLVLGALLVIGLCVVMMTLL